MIGNDTKGSFLLWIQPIFLNNVNNKLFISLRSRSKQLINVTFINNINLVRCVITSFDLGISRKVFDSLLQYRLVFSKDSSPPCLRWLSMFRLYGSRDPTSGRPSSQL